MESLDGLVWMVVRFVGVIRVLLCARVSRVYPVCRVACARVCPGLPPPGVLLPARAASAQYLYRTVLYAGKWG